MIYQGHRELPPESVIQKPNQIAFSHCCMVFIRFLSDFSFSNGMKPTWNTFRWLKNWWLAGPVFAPIHEPCHVSDITPSKILMCEESHVEYRQSKLSQHFIRRKASSPSLEWFDLSLMIALIWAGWLETKCEHIWTFLRLVSHLTCQSLWTTSLRKPLYYYPAMESGSGDSIFNFGL